MVPASGALTPQVMFTQRHHPVFSWSSLASEAEAKWLRIAAGGFITVLQLGTSYRTVESTWNALVVWSMAFMTFHILGMLSSQLTNSIIFQRGRAQPATSHDFGRFFPWLQKGWEGSTLGWTNRVTKWHGPPSRVFHQGKSPVQRVQSRFFFTIPVTLLVGGLEHGFYDFPYIGKFIIPTDFHIFQRGWNHQPEDVISPSWWLITFKTPLLAVFLPDNSLDWKCWLAFPGRYNITSLRTHHVTSYKKPVPGLGMNHARNLGISSPEIRPCCFDGRSIVTGESYWYFFWMR